MMSGWYKYQSLCAFIFMVICTSCPLMATGHIPEITLNNEIDGQRLTSIPAVYTSTETLDADSAWQQLSEHGISGELDFGFSESVYWLGFTAVNRSEANIWIIEIENPHIDFVDVYIRPPGGDEWELIEQTGDKTPYHTRTITHYNYAIPLNFENADSLNVLVMLDKRPSSMSYHTVLWSVTNFNRYQQAQYGLNGVYFGILLIVLLASAIAFLFSGNMLYLWYMLFVATNGLFVFTDLGLSFQYLYPSSETLNNSFRVYLAIFMGIFLIRFTQEYFATKSSLPFNHKLFNGLTGAHIVLLLPVLLIPDYVTAVIGLFLPALYFVILATMVLAFYTAIAMLRIDRGLAIFYLVAYTFILAGGTITILIEFGIITKFHFRFTALQIAAGIEIFILTCAISWRIKKVNDHRMALNARVSRMETETLRAHIDGIEKERNRVAMALHDSIGNRLANLKRMLEGVMPEAETNLEETIDEVRNISHQLSPAGIKLSGLEKQVRQLIDETDKHSKTTYHLHTVEIPEDTPESFNIEIYRIIQEAVHNIEKHSKADHADIQIINHECVLVITIEDDGVGLPENKQTGSGIGLHNLKQRVALLKGTLDLTSRPGQGVQYLIEIPLPEQSDQDT